jgi:hypothetical protein
MGSQQFTELARIPIRVGPPRGEGALTPIADGDTVVLRSRVPEGTSAPIGVNVDSLLLLDALEDGTVFEVEVVVPQSSWRSGAPAPTPMSGIEKGSIVIADPGPKIYVDQVSPRFTVDSRGRLHIQLEPADGETRWVALSAECYALLNGNFLAGFVALLAR